MAQLLWFDDLPFLFCLVQQSQVGENVSGEAPVNVNVTPNKTSSSTLSGIRSTPTGFHQAPDAREKIFCVQALLHIKIFVNQCSFVLPERLGLFVLQLEKLLLDFTRIHHINLQVNRSTEHRLDTFHDLSVGLRQLSFVHHESFEIRFVHFEEVGVIIIGLTDPQDRPPICLLLLLVHHIYHILDLIFTRCPITKNGERGLQMLFLWYWHDLRLKVELGALVLKLLHVVVDCDLPPPLQSFTSGEFWSNSLEISVA